MVSFKPSERFLHFLNSPDALVDILSVLFMFACAGWPTASMFGCLFPLPSLVRMERLRRLDTRARRPPLFLSTDALVLPTVYCIQPWSISYIFFNARIASSYRPL